ncbi:hypothetical protein [Pseudomonas viridiflava]|uniref:Uncharacterized protein n=1 Tax=Pseudomonas viridiflava TaxID=33069 RepID=A0A3M5PC90_PSEVI|nr:hypothetical protein [Pseudomonas viridiflava]RMT81905.1 hypothetical protein ALP40_01850 [Pseudomonas viridiflava]
MSKLKEYRAIEQQLNAHIERLEALSKEERFLDELVFERKLRALLKRYSLEKSDLMKFLSSPFGLSEKRISEPRTYDGRTQHNSEDQEGMRVEHQPG